MSNDAAALQVDVTGGGREPVARVVSTSSPYGAMLGMQPIWKMMLFVSGLMFAVCFLFGVSCTDYTDFENADNRQIWRRVMNSGLAKNGVNITVKLWNAAETNPLTDTPYLNGIRTAMDPPSLMFVANVTQAGTLFMGCLIVSLVMFVSSVEGERYPKSQGAASIYAFVHDVVSLGVMCQLSAGLIFMYRATVLYAEIYYPRYTSLLASVGLEPGFSLNPPVMHGDWTGSNPSLLNVVGYHQTIVSYGVLSVWMWLGAGLGLHVISTGANRLATSDW